MHELSLVASLFDIVKEKAEEKNAVRVISIKLQVGILSGVVPELMESAFDIYKKDSIADKARLITEKIPLKVQCRECGNETTRDDYILTCSKCGSSDLKTLAGTDLIIEKIELEI